MLKFIFIAVLAMINYEVRGEALSSVDKNGIVMDGNVLRRWPKEFSGVAVIPEGICHIGDNAFFRCRNVTGVVFPKSLLLIGDSAFSQCHGLREVVIPVAVTNIGARAFDFCGNLTNVVVEASVESIPEGMCGRCRLLAHVGLPKNLRRIKADAFLACRSLRSVVIPSGVTTISQKAFALCSNLERVEIPCGLKSIEDRAFAWCYSLVNVDGVKKVDELGKDVFLENGLFHRNVGMPGFAKVIRLATEGLLHDDVDRSVNLTAMDSLAAHADDIKIGMSRSDLDGVIRRLGCSFGHGFEEKDDGRLVQISTMLRFGLSSKGGVGVSLKYKNGMVYDIELTEAFKFFAEIGAKRLGFKIGKPEQRWLEVRKYE